MGFALGATRDRARKTLCLDKECPPRRGATKLLHSLAAMEIPIAPARTAERTGGGAVPSAAALGRALSSRFRPREAIAVELDHLGPG